MKEPQKLSPKKQGDLDSRLIEAAYHGNTETVKVLLASGANVHAEDDLALRCAAYDGYTEMVKVLLASGANVHAKDDEALCWAAMNGHTEMVRTLLAGSAHVDEALCWAAMNGHTEMVRTLLAGSAHVHAEDDCALRRAAYWGHTETVQILAAHIFSPDSWRGKSRIAIEAYASTLYDKIKVNVPQPERLGIVRTILLDCALTCWEQVRPPPPKLTISPLPAQPRPV
jgi:hypothetical protein